MAIQVGILGTGSVAQNLARELARAGHRVTLGSREPAHAKGRLAGLPQGIAVASLRDAAGAQVVVLAVPYGSLSATIQAVGPEALRGKVLVDATNVLTPNYE